MRFFRNLLSALILVTDCLGTGPEGSFHWTPYLEDSLLEILEHSNMLGNDSKHIMKAEWDQKFPMFSHLDSDYLWKHAQTLVGMSGKNHEKRKRTDVFKWEPKFRSELVEIYKNTNPDAKNHSVRIYNEWVKRHEEFSYMRPSRLLRNAQTFMDESRRKKPRVEDRWTGELDDELMKVARKNARFSGRIHQEWISEHTEVKDISPQQLRQRVRKLENSRNSTDGNRIKNTLTKPDWTKEQDENLMRIYYKNQGNSKKVHQEFVAKYSTLGSLAPKQLQQRAHYLTRRGNMTDKIKARKYFKWKDDLNADLFHIHRRTKKGVGNKGNCWDRIWQCWKEMHPDLTGIKKNQLQLRRKYLLSARYKPSAEDEQKARERFDKLSVARLYKYDSTESPPERSGRKGKRVVSPSRDLPSTSRQHHDDHDQYEDMMMFSPLPYEHFYDDPHQYTDPTSLSHTPYEDQYPPFHKGNEHHG